MGVINIFEEDIENILIDFFINLKNYFLKQTTFTYMYCKNCGVQIDDNSIFCSKCGTNLVSNEKFVEEIVKPSESNFLETDSSEINTSINTTNESIPTSYTRNIWIVIKSSFNKVGFYKIIIIGFALTLFLLLINFIYEKSNIDSVEILDNEINIIPDESESYKEVIRCNDYFTIYSNHSESMEKFLVLDMQRGGRSAFQIINMNDNYVAVGASNARRSYNTFGEALHGGEDIGMFNLWQLFRSSINDPFNRKDWKVGDPLFSSLYETYTLACGETVVPNRFINKNTISKDMPNNVEPNILDKESESILQEMFRNSKINSNNNQEYVNLNYDNLKEEEKSIKLFSSWTKYNVPISDDPNEDRFYPKLDFTATILDKYYFNKNNKKYVFVKTIERNNEESGCMACSIKVIYAVFQLGNDDKLILIDELEDYESIWYTTEYEFLKISDNNVAIVNEHFSSEGSVLFFVAFINNKLKGFSLKDKEEKDVDENFPNFVFFNEDILMYCDQDTGKRMHSDNPCYNFEAKYHFDQKGNFYTLVVERFETFSEKRQTKIYDFDGENYLLKSIEEK